jgi:hypothetical protein
MIERFYGNMERLPDDSGQWVRYSDYADLERQIAELRAEYLNASKDAIELAGKLNAAEAEIARLRALPLKDEAERLTYGQKLIAEAIEHHFGERTEDYDEDADDTATHDVWEAFDTLLSRLRAGEQEGWQQCGWAYQDKQWDEGRWHVCGMDSKPREHDGRLVQPIYVAASPSVSEGGSRP